MKLSLIYESLLNESNDIISSFKNLTTSDIELETSASFGHMSIKIKFIDDYLQKIYTKLMMEDFDEPTTTVDLETNNINNIHIDAIPYKLRGLGLGKVIYKKIIEEFDFISTGFNYARISDEAQRVWESLINSGDFYYFISNDNRVTLAKKEDHPIIYKSFIDYYGDRLKSTNFNEDDIDYDEWDY